MNDVYTAIMRAADQIATHPERFAFMSVGIPIINDCDTSGCALGWISAYMGFAPAYIDYGTAAHHMGLQPEALNYTEDSGGLCCVQFAFYNRLTEACGNDSWKKDAAICAEDMRRYAAKYHKPDHPALPIEA